MAGQANPAPRGTRALIAAIMEALDGISEVNRKAAFKHASAAVKDKLIAQAERAKAAARKAPAKPGAKRRAAVAATRRAAAEEGAARTRAGATRGRARAGTAGGAARRGRRPADEQSVAPELDEDVSNAVR